MTHRIIQNRKIYFIFSGLIITLSILALIFWGLNFGIDFTGGSLLEGQFINYRPSVVTVQKDLQPLNLHSLVVQPSNNNYVILRFQENSETVHQEVVTKLKSLAASHSGASFKELQFNAVGPSIGQELKSKSFDALVITLIMIILFIAFVFRKVSKPVSSWKYGVTAIIALTHDILFTLGVFAVLGHFYGVKINTPFIAAILTVLGYSINDTIIVFDRIRDNLPKSRDNFEGTVNTSVNQTISRSVNTSLSSILALLAVLFFGGSTIKDFALALIVGVTVGTYSSIFIASPLLVAWNNISHRKKTV